MTSLHVICGLGPPQSKILATPMVYIVIFRLDFSIFTVLRITKTTVKYYSDLFSGGHIKEEALWAISKNQP